MVDRPGEPNLAALFDGPQQMSVGERAALEGFLELAKPALAIEIGRAEGGSLRRIAAHSAEVHSLDLVAPPAELAELEQVHFHTGDSHELLPSLLAELASAGRNVDLVLVDGDHSADGVRRDLEDLLASPAVSRTLILIHDTTNEEVRAGDRVDLDRAAKVAYADLDAVSGRLFRAESLRKPALGRARGSWSSTTRARAAPASRPATRASSTPRRCCARPGPGASGARATRRGGCAAGSSHSGVAERSRAQRTATPGYAGVHVGPAWIAAAAVSAERPQIALVSRELAPFGGGGIGPYVAATARRWRPSPR